MIILGIDPGTARMGYGVVEIAPKKKSQVVKLLATNVLTTPAGEDAHKRLLMLFNFLNGLVKDYSPDIMVVEKIFFNTNVKTALSVGQARGISMLVAASKKIEFFEYTALQAKLVLTGYGRSDKKQMQAAVMESLKLPEIIKSDDANDAVAMALCHIKKVYEPPSK